MKKLYIVIIFTFLILSPQVFADNVGPGLGRNLMSGNNDKFSEVMAVTSNNVTSTKYCAITSGSSGHQKGAIIGYNNAQQYLDENMDMVAHDMARGEGEHLDTLLELMEIDNKNAARIMMKKNFSKIYTHENVTSTEVITNILEVQKG
jgi:hypothetical protein